MKITTIEKEWRIETLRLNGGWIPQVGDEVQTISLKFFIIIKLYRSESSDAIGVRLWDYESITGENRIFYITCSDQYDSQYNVFLRLIQARPQ
jgi:hypothetical protein